MVYKLGHVQSPNFKVGNQKLLYNYKPSPQFPTTQGIKILGCLKIPPEKTTKESLFKSMGSCHHPPATSPGKMEATSFVKKKTFHRKGGARPSVLAPKAPLNRSSLTLMPFRGKV